MIMKLIDTRQCSAIKRLASANVSVDGICVSDLRRIQKFDTDPGRHRKLDTEMKCVNPDTTYKS